MIKELGTPGYISWHEYDWSHKKYGPESLSQWCQLANTNKSPPANRDRLAQKLSKECASTPSNPEVAT